MKKFFLIVHVVTVFIIILFYGCRISNTGKVVKNIEITPYWPEWKYLSEFMSDIPLPALYTESSNHFHYCCISGTDNVDTANPDLYVDDKCMNMIHVIRKTRAILCTLMVGALPEEKKEKQKDIFTILSTWHGIIFGINYIYINPESICFAFDNKYCAIPDSSWYSEGSEIAVGAVVIDSILMISEDKLPKESVDLLQSYLQSGNLKSRFGLTFKLTRSPRGYFKVTVHNIAYAIRTISPYIRKVHVSFDTLCVGKKYSLNGFNFSINDNKDNPTMYHLSIYPKKGRKQTYCGVLGENRAFAINSKCIGTIQPKRTEYGYKSDIIMLIIGIQQNQIQDFFN